MLIFNQRLEWEAEVAARLIYQLLKLQLKGLQVQQIALNPRIIKNLKN